MALRGSSPPSERAGSVPAREVFKSALEAAVAFAEQGLADREVNLSVGDVGVAHVSGEDREFVQEVKAFLVPLVEPVHGEGVAEVVDPRAAGNAVRNLCFVQTLVEGQMNQDVVESLAAMNEEALTGVLGWIQFQSARQICGELVGCGQTQRDEAFFMEFGVPEGKGAVLEIHVADSQAESFSEPDP